MKWLFKLFFRKQKAAYTTASGVLKHLSVLLYKVLENEKDTSNCFFVSNDVVEVYPVVFSKDGTALKSSIQFDKDGNVNVGLENHEMTLEQCQPKLFLEKKLLLEKLICEAVVCSATSLNNDVCMPVAVHFCSKVKKSGDNIKVTFLDQIRLIQICESCIVRTKMKIWFWRRATSWVVRATATIVSLVILFVEIVQLRRDVRQPCVKSLQLLSQKKLSLC